jgi:hypothetical protein
MKSQYDFSKGEKGKFYISEDEIELPIYLNSEIQKFYLNLASKNKIALSELISNILNKDIEIANIILPN